MRAPTAAELLGVWGRCAGLRPAARADALLEPVAAGEDPSALTLGERDARLLALRELLFGGDLEGSAECPSCCELVEYALPPDQLHRAGEAAAGELELSELGYDVCFRLPTGADLAAAAATGGLEAARTLLLERCVLSARRGGRERAAAELPAPVVAELAERLAEAEPLADAQLALSCPACGHEWAIALDIGAWLWSELDAWARRTVLEVHALASAYGWSEAEILALGARRELYLELLEG